ncbi:DegT/DnrJ/EryC1/StrS family aminotransferase [Nocardioides sp. MAHUQ-72]|uniref:DegT/DnrJ/EryC1/StrS family aminotransferase n=1 Tax=unclassified Nocardioides TaxID=2615069 RepID=UPI003614908E
MTRVPTTPDRAEKVPFLDLQLQNDAVGGEVIAAMREVCRTGAFVLGPRVHEFEAEYAAFCGVNHCVGVGNGTDAIELAVRAAGLGPGDEVILPANTFVATAEAVARAGAVVVLADCDDDYLIDPADVRRRTTRRTRGVIGVDLYGQVAPFDQLRAAVDDDVVLIEDGAQSQGATRFGRPAGSFGAVSATSFYPGKNLGAFGDAGAVTTDDLAVSDRVRALRNHGGVRKYEHGSVGTNSRLDSLQAAVLSIKLERLKGWNNERVEAAQRYAEMLAGVDGVTLPRSLAGNEHVWHLYVVRVRERARVLERLASAGIGTGIHYPTPIHLMPAFAHLGMPRGSFPRAEALAEEIVSLPMYPGLTGCQQEKVVATLTEAVRP